MNLFSVIPVVLLCVALVSVARAAVGGDVATAVSESQWSCAANAGWEFTIIRGNLGNSNGDIDPNVLNNLANAGNAGILYRDVYFTPCLSLDPFQQLSNAVNAINMSNFGTLWISVAQNTNPKCQWAADTLTNCNFLQAIINEGNNIGLTMGIYTSAFNWGSLVGQCEGPATGGLRLWYAHFDGTQSYSDYSPFGAWYHPAMKQYTDASNAAQQCGFSAGGNWW